MNTAELPIVRVSTWTVYERLYGGGTRKLAAHLTRTEQMAWHCPDYVWDVFWVLDEPAAYGPPNYHPED
jgi:hypothetical protein